MKMFYGNTEINSIKVKHYSVNTNDANVVPSDVQSGRTYYAKGKKGTGTGKSFEFARYGAFKTNFPIYIPLLINIIEIASIEHPVKLNIALKDILNTDFSTTPEIGCILIDNVECPITVSVNENILTLSCPQTVFLEVFYGKDNYI